jgi:lipopolysaccharide/colanic/teichoic acid biosynthesis glycosyltransferase/O-antigen ligase
MADLSIRAEPIIAPASRPRNWFWLTVIKNQEFDGLSLALALCFIPISIAATESLLAIAAALRFRSLLRNWKPLYIPRALWFWLVWAALELFAWLRSPDTAAGKGEIRHLFLIAALFFLLPALNSATDRVAVRRGIVLSGTISSIVLIGTFFSRLHVSRGDVDPVVYLRSGGLLHHWMVYGSVEILIFAGLLQLWHFYPEERWWLLPAFAINVAASVLSLTRMLWICCLLLLAIHLLWIRSRWIWALPVIPCVLFFLTPQVVRSRVIDSMHSDYYPNTERVQMLRVGWEMIRAQPITGVGPGRVEKLYRGYLAPNDPVPAFHGHLHNNFVQLAAEFGLPVAGAAIAFVGILFLDLRRRHQLAVHRHEQLLCRTALLGLTGFVASGMFDYTYGHSLALILLSFVVLSPILEALSQSDAGERPIPSRALEVTDRALGVTLAVASLPVIVTAAAVTVLLSKRSPFVAHLRVGQHGQTFWMWKLRTMWPRHAPIDSELIWLEQIEADPVQDEKLENDPRVTSRFASFCRRHSIDELPQLIHVIRGEMSLVGPRPVTKTELARHYGATAEQVLTVKPGLTGYWQTQGRSRLSYTERVDRDLALIKDLSLRVYCRVLLTTIPAVLNGRNAR